MIRVGFLGTGNISQRHFTALASLRDRVEVVAVCDVVEERARTAAAPFGARVHLSSHEMLARERLDALYVCLPPDAHVDQELAAAARGIHLFVEKPLPLDLAKAEQIARAVRANGIVSAVGYHWRHFSHTRHLRDLLAGERVGMAMGYFLNILPKSPWWRVKSRSGGQVVEQAIHIVDTSRFLLGEVDRVWADYAQRVNTDEPGFDQEDVYTLQLRFQSGAIATYAVCCVLHRRYLVGLDVVCKNRLYRLRERELEIDDADGIRSVPLNNDPGLAENVAFISAIATGDRSGILSDYEDALRTQRVVMAANRAAETGEPVRLIHD
jgi:myo-inositol 2-dehydrogenase / D-chiro-inositol 1-dehydrogenase